MRQMLLQPSMMGYSCCMTKKLLIIRFSSFGDIVQSMACIPELAKSFEVDYLTKTPFAALPRLSPQVAHIHAFDSKQGLLGLIKLAWNLRALNYDAVYDAHQNPRSKIVRFLVSFLRPTKVYIRPKSRWRRFLFFKLKKRDALPMPFKGMISFCAPVNVKPQSQQWDFSQLISSERRSELEQYCQKVVLVPSAAWEMKRWPKEHWESLVLKLTQESIVLGGPEDHFCQEIAARSQHAVNLAGKLSLIESCYLVSKAKAVVSADTGLLHVADLLGIPVLALLGPTAFGHPTFKNAIEVGVELSCRPCTKDGRGTCIQPVWRKCMVDISPEHVITKLTEITN